jgi:hypothetical protein
MCVFLSAGNWTQGLVLELYVYIPSLYQGFFSFVAVVETSIVAKTKKQKQNKTEQKNQKIT